MAKAPPIPHQLVRIDWEDSARPISAWQWVEDYALPETVVCVSVGFLIADTEAAVAIAPNLGDIGHDRLQASGIIRIPRCSIKRMIVISPSWGRGAPS